VVARYDGTSARSCKECPEQPGQCCRSASSHTASAGAPNNRL